MRLVAVLRGAGFPSWSVADIRAVEWYKLCALLPGALVTTLSRRSYAGMALHPHLARLFVQVMRETFGVMHYTQLLWGDAGDVRGDAGPGDDGAGPARLPWRFAEWLPAPDEVSLEGLRAIGERQRDAGERMLPSMLQDVLAGRLTEVEHLAGEVLGQAAALDLPVPATETCYRLIRGLEDAPSYSPLPLRAPPGPSSGCSPSRSTIHFSHSRAMVTTSSGASLGREAAKSAAALIRARRRISVLRSTGRGASPGAPYAGAGGDAMRPRAEAAQRAVEGRAPRRPRRRPRPPAHRRPGRAADRPRSPRGLQGSGAPGVPPTMVRALMKRSRTTSTSTSCPVSARVTWRNWL